MLKDQSPLNHVLHCLQKAAAHFSNWPTISTNCFILLTNFSFLSTFFVMDFSLKLRSSPSSFSLTCRKFHSPINHPLRHQLPIVPPPSLKLKPRTFLTASGNRQLTVMAKLSKSLEGVSQELNLIASQNLDHAPARRRVRSAFTQVQQQLHHPLLKVCLFSWFDHDSDSCLICWMRSFIWFWAALLIIYYIDQWSYAFSFPCWFLNLVGSCWD